MLGGFYQLHHEIGHFDGGHRRVETFVAALGASPVNGLFHRIGSENAERNRNSGFQREAPMGESYLDPADPATGPLEAMLQQELRAIMVDCFPKLEREQRQVLTMRVNGLKYGEIASRLGVNENTVATWVSRGIRELGRSVRKRMEVR